MLKLKNITVEFDNKQVLDNISCTVNPGDFIVIVGTNGTGKSTLFNTIAGAARPTNGTIELDGLDITHTNEQQRAQTITRIFQNTHQNCVGSLTVEQNLAIAQLARRSARLINGMKNMPKEFARSLLRRFDIDPSLLSKPMRELSGGQRQLIAFAMATQQIPQLLLLDEPTAALDPQAATTLLKHAVNFIKQHNITTLLITHDPQIALNVGNKIWVLDNGTISKEFDPEQKKTLKADNLIGQIDYQLLGQMEGSIK